MFESATANFTKFFRAKLTALNKSTGLCLKLYYGRNHQEVFCNTYFWRMVF